MLADRVPVSDRPTGLRHRRSGPLLSNLTATRFVIAGLPKVYPAAFATLLSHRARARQGLQTAGLRETLAIIAKLRQ